MNPLVAVDGVRWRALPFEALTVQELYSVLRLRAEVFVVEQRCAFQDLDGLDPQAVHLLGETAQTEAHEPPLAYARLLPPGTAFAEASIGRVVTSRAARGSGLGHRLMAEAIGELHRRWGVQAIRLGAQAHLQSYYRQSGFVPEGSLYLEDGIDHIEMVRP